MDNLENWLHEHNISFTKKEEDYEIEGLGLCVIINDYTQFEKGVPEIEGYQYVLFYQAGCWYHTKMGRDFAPQLLHCVGRNTAWKRDSPFPVLGVHGKFEIGRGVGEYEDWCKAASFEGIDCLGLCERNTVSGVISFISACKKTGIRPIVGGSCVVFEDNEQGEVCYVNVKLYAKNEEGFLYLSRLMCRAEANEKFLLSDLLLDDSFNNCVLVFDLPSLCRQTRSRWSYILSYLKHWEPKASFYYNHYSFNGNDNLFANYNRILSALGSLKRIVTIKDCYYPTLDEKEAHETLLQMKSSSFFNSDGNLSLERFDTTASFIHEDFTEDKSDLIVSTSRENLISIKEACKYVVPTDVFYPPMSPFLNVDQTKALRSFCEQGMRALCLEKKPEYVERLKYELKVIEKGHYESYFLLLWDICYFCRRNNILMGLGRGSAVGSLVAYILRITQIDPLKYNLLFERFLNEGRVGKSLPDIDLDIASEHRQAVKGFLLEKYGMENCYEVMTVQAYKLKNLISDFLRVKGEEFASIKRTTAHIDEVSNDDLKWSSILMMKGNKTVENLLTKYPELIEIIRGLFNCPRDKGVHASAFIVAPLDRQARQLLPFNRKEDKGYEVPLLITQWEGVDAEKAGFLKNDLLGVEFLTLVDKLYIDKTNLNSIWRGMPLDKELVYTSFSRGMVQGCFHLGTPLQKDYCTKLKPRKFEDLVLQIALIRPGALSNNTHLTILKRREGREPVPSDEISQMLSDTYGLMVYQEQVMQVFQHITKCSLVLADDVRKCLGKKDKDKMFDFYSFFKKEGLKNGYEEKYLEKIWKQLVKFGAYGFNKSHAVAYAHLAYYSMFLKVKHPERFYSIFWESAKTPLAQALLLSEAKRMNIIKWAALHVNLARITPYIRDDTFQWGVSSLKHVSLHIANDIFVERTNRGEFTSLEDFMSRLCVTGKTKVSRNALINLIICGAFDYLPVRTGESLLARDTLRRKQLIDHVRKEKPIPIEALSAFDKYLLDSFEAGLHLKEYWWLSLSFKLSGLCPLSLNTLAEEYNLREGRFKFEVEDLYTPANQNIAYMFYDKFWYAGVVVETSCVYRNKKKHIRLSCMSEHTVSLIYIDQSEIQDLEDRYHEGTLIALSGTLKEDGALSTSPERVYTFNVCP